MTFTHREEHRAGLDIDWLEDEERGIRVGIARLGAELISIQRRDLSGRWIGFLHRDNDLSPVQSGWANHATVMGYFLHRLKDGRSIYRGEEIRGGTHSFLRTKRWHLISSENGSVTYRISPEDFSHVEYPLNVSVELTYWLREEAVEVEFKFTNAEPELTAHVGFGIHPGFAAQSFESFALKMPAGKYRRHFSPENYLSGETEEIDFPGGEMPFARLKLPGSFILELIQTASPEFLFADVASGRSLIFDLGNAPYVTLWSDGGPFLCIEPCWGLTDHHEQRAFEDKEGIQKIPPRGELRAGCTIKPRLPGCA